MSVARMHELMRKHTKEELLRMAFAGGLVDYNSPEKWRKDEIAAVVADQEERRSKPEPAPIDFTRPYGYKVERADGVKDWTFCTGYITRPELSPETTEADAALDAAMSVRITQPQYRGALRVYVWQHRGDAEHYRNPVPEDAFVADYPATTA